MKFNEKLTVEWNKTYSTKMTADRGPRSLSGNFYSISRDANPLIKQPDFKVVLYYVDYIHRLQSGRRTLN